MIMKKNIIISVLLQLLSKTSKSLIKSDDKKLLTVLFKLLIKVNEIIESNFVMYKDLQPTDAKTEIKIIDDIYTALDSMFDLLFLELEANEKDFFLNEYNRLIDNLENIREGLELYLDIDLMNTINQITKKDYSDFIKVA